MVATAAEWAQTFARVREHEPDVVLLDMAMDDALAGVNALASSAPGVRIVALG